MIAGFWSAMRLFSRDDDIMPVFCPTSQIAAWHGKPPAP